MKKRKRLKNLDLDERDLSIKKAKKVILIVMTVSFIIFVIISALAILNQGYSYFIKSLLSINLFYFSLAFVVLFLGYIIRYPKWELYLKKLGIHISRTKNFIVYLSMYSMDITPGRWGRGVVAYTINRITKTRFAKIFPAVVADNFTDFFGFIILSLFMSFLVGKYLILSIFITILLMLPFIFFFNKGPFELLKNRFGNVRWLRGFFKEGAMYFKNSNSLGIGTYIYSMIYTVPSMFLNGVALYFVILSTGINIGISLIPIVVFVYTSSLLIGIITGIPGALGVTDAALISYLTLFFGPIGVGFALASIITILFRIVSLWFVEGFGFAAFAITLKYW
ncbi:MAG: lysylphosphatidylglycerol synthase transmembrane domain-containing protein [Candidatus Micrarchaeaceae archaeon]